MTRFALLVCSLAASLGCGVQPAPPADVPTSATIEASGVSNEGTAPPVPRQIIYRASVLIYVQDFGAADRQIQSLIKESGGYIAQFREDRPAGSIRGGKWTARVPAEKFNAFVDAVCRLGVAEHREVQSDEVTEEFVDISARLKNKQALESRLLELVARRTDAIRDVVALENELSRVREEIERMQGRLRYLADRVALTTVEITAYERLDYRPPEVTLAGRIAHTFLLSLDKLQFCAESALLVVVALLPWGAAILLIGAPIALLFRWRMIRARRHVKASPV